MRFLRDRRFSFLDVAAGFLLAKLLVAALAYAGGLPGHVSPGEQAKAADFNAVLDAVTAIQSSEVMKLNPYLTVSETDDPTSLVRGPIVRLSGVNLQLVSGDAQSRTDEGGCNGADMPACSGLGNLIVGYAENSGALERSGTHNLMVGPYHAFSSYGGAVLGFSNRIAAGHASVTGGSHNAATGERAAVSGGFENVASGFASSASGGIGGEASGHSASVSGGGGENVASGDGASVSGGRGNEAAANYSAVAGGSENRVEAEQSYGFIGGGQENRILASSLNGFFGAILGGQGNEVRGCSRCALVGGYVNDAFGDYSSVVGGTANRTPAGALYASVTGGSDNAASGNQASVTGGTSNTASGAGSAVQGGYGNTAAGDGTSIGGGVGKSLATANRWRGGRLYMDGAGADVTLP